MFLCKYYNIFKKTYLEEHLRTAAPFLPTHKYYGATTSELGSFKMKKNQWLIFKLLSLPCLSFTYLVCYAIC